MINTLRNYQIGDTVAFSYDWLKKAGRVRSHGKCRGKVIAIDGSQADVLWEDNAEVMVSRFEVLALVWRPSFGRR